MVVNVFFSAVTQATMSRHELLAWVNDSLQSQLTKIEEMSTGAAYCGLTDFLFPGSLPIKKVKWNSKNEVDYINNWNILQKAWKELGIDKPVPVERLLKAKFQENFEFLQWFKKFFDANWEDHEYDALGVRNGEEYPAALPGGAKRPAPPKVSAPRPTQAPATRTAPRAAPPASKPAPSTRTSLGGKPITTKSTTTAPPAASNGTAAIASAVAAAETKFKTKIDELTASNQELTTTNHELAETLTGLEKERDFYFSKLRAIEILCSEIGEGNQINVDKITQILYETEEGETYVEAGEQEAEPNIENHADITIEGIEHPVIDVHHPEIEVKENNGVQNGRSDAELLAQAAKIDLNDSETF